MSDCWHPFASIAIKDSYPTFNYLSKHLYVFFLIFRFSVVLSLIELTVGLLYVRPPKPEERRGQQRSSVGTGGLHEIFNSPRTKNSTTFWVSRWICTFWHNLKFLLRPLQPRSHLFFVPSIGICFNMVGKWLNLHFKTLTNTVILFLILK